MKIFVIVSLFFCAASYACDGIPETPPTRFIEGDYSVPVSESELIPFASYPVARVGWRQCSEEVSLGYHLPQELTGSADNLIILKGRAPAAGNFELRSDNGRHRGDCTRSPSEDGLGRVSCRIRYRELNTDTAQLARVLVDEFPEPTELRARARVSRAFMGDPVGILSFADDPDIPADL